MLLSELEWSDLSQYCKRAKPAFGLCVFWHHVTPERYSIYEYPYRRRSSPSRGWGWFRLKKRWENLDALTAQAILFHLTSEGNDAAQ